MKLRGANRFALGYYRLIGSVHLGEPVQAGDAELSDNHGKRDRLLRQYLQKHTLDDTEEPHDPTQREDSPAQPLELQGPGGGRAPGDGAGAGPDGEPRS